MLAPDSQNYIFLFFLRPMTSTLSIGKKLKFILQIYMKILPQAILFILLITNYIFLSVPEGVFYNGRKVKNTEFSWCFSRMLVCPEFVELMQTLLCKNWWWRFLTAARWLLQCVKAQQSNRNTPKHNHVPSFDIWFMFEIKSRSIW